MGFKTRPKSESVSVPPPGQHTEWEVLAKGEEVWVSFYDERTEDLHQYARRRGVWRVRHRKSPFQHARPSVFRLRKAKLALGASLMARGYGKRINEKRRDFDAPWTKTSKKASARRPSSTTVDVLVRSFTELEAKLASLGLRRALSQSRRPTPSGCALAPASVLELTPPAYREFVAAIGYRTFSIGERSPDLTWLPPNWVRYLTRAIGDPAHSYDAVRSLRNKGKYEYQYVVFAASDVSEFDGFCFGPSERDGHRVVMKLDRSLPESELGLFEDWMRKQLASLHRKADALSST